MTTYEAVKRACLRFETEGVVIDDDVAYAVASLWIRMPGMRQVCEDGTVTLDLLTSIGQRMGCHSGDFPEDIDALRQLHALKAWAVERKN